MTFNGETFLGICLGCMQEPCINAKETCNTCVVCKRSTCFSPFFGSDSNTHLGCLSEGEQKYEEKRWGRCKKCGIVETLGTCCGPNRDAHFYCHAYGVCQVCRRGRFGWASYGTSGKVHEWCQNRENEIGRHQEILDALNFGKFESVTRVTVEVSDDQCFDTLIVLADD